MKKYIANTNVSINVVLPGGKNKHVSFSSITNGGSVFYTDNSDLQQSLESHYKYGKLFSLDPSSAQEEKKKVVKQSTTQTQPENTIKENEDKNPPIEENIEDKIEEVELPEQSEEEIELETGEEKNTSGLKEVKVTDFDSAKDYLSEKFGISRTKLRSQKAILEVAEANGIKFIGI